MARDWGGLERVCWKRSRKEAKTSGDDLRRWSVISSIVGCGIQNSASVDDIWADAVSGSWRARSRVSVSVAQYDSLNRC
jgi:hypothetical protein